jgi:hypothetical protein
MDSQFTLLKQHEVLWLSTSFWNWITHIASKFTSLYYDPCMKNLLQTILFFLKLAYHDLFILNDKIFWLYIYIYRKIILTSIWCILFQEGSTLFEWAYLQSRHPKRQLNIKTIIKDYFLFFTFIISWLQLSPFKQFETLCLIVIFVLKEYKGLY